MGTEGGRSWQTQGPTMAVEMHRGTKAMLGTPFQKYSHISSLPRH